MHMFLAADQTASLLDYLSRASIITFLIIVVYGGYKMWWVFGWYYKEALERCTLVETRLAKMEQEKNAWRETALKGANIATRAFEEFQKPPGS